MRIVGAHLVVNIGRIIIWEEQAVAAVSAVAEAVAVAFQEVVEAAVLVVEAVAVLEAVVLAEADRAGVLAVRYIIGHHITDHIIM